MPDLSGFLPSDFGLAELLTGEDGLAYRDTLLRATRVMSRAKQLCPVGKVHGGGLRGSIRLNPTVTPAGFVVQVGSDKDYAAAVHEGTRPHRIEPRNASVLVFQVGNRKVFAMHVNHPGTRGKPFLRDALPAGFA